MFTWVLPVIHGKAKASAAMQGKSLEEWGEEAVMEKLAREEKARNRFADAAAGRD